MHKSWILLSVALAVVLTAGLLHSPAASAEDVVARALDASTSAATLRVGDHTWIEEAGIGIELHPAPPATDFPRMLAGNAWDGTRSAALWELGPEGVAALRRVLEQSGATLEGSTPAPWRPRGYPTELSALKTRLSFADARRGVMLDWSASGRRFAIVVADGSPDAADRKLDDLQRGMIMIDGVARNCIAPLMFEGRYTGVLSGWQRDDVRLRRREPQGWMSLRVFQVPATDFESIDRLQREVENSLKDAGIKRTGGQSPSILGSEGFIGEYSGTDLFVQRIAFARLPGGYLVALMQAPIALRAMLASEMDAFAASLRSTGLMASTSASPLPFHRVSRIRIHAWHDGDSLMWGVLFDDGRQQAVIWRQDAVNWSVQLTRAGEVIDERAGEINSSRALNPLVDADLRAMRLPRNFSGDVELVATVGGLTARTRLTLKPASGN